MNILLDSRYLGVTKGKTHNKFYNLYKKKWKSGWFEQNRFFVGGGRGGGNQQSIKLSVSLSMVEIKNTFNLNL